MFSSLCYEFELLFRRNVLVFDLIQLLLGHRYSNRDADLCIDGFPRSANSFAVMLLMKADPSLNLIHHTHSSAVIKKSLSDGIPTVTLIREPKAAVTSEYIRAKHADKIVYTIPNLIKRYIQYYGVVYDHIDELNVFTFNYVTCNPKNFLIDIFRLLSKDQAYDFESVVKMTQKDIKHAVRSENVFTVSAPSEERNRYKNDVMDKMISVHDFSAAETLYYRIVDAPASR